VTETVFVAAHLDGQTVDVGTAYFARRNNVVSTPRWSCSASTATGTAASAT
jgi:hypothetical protein